LRGVVLILQGILQKKDVFSCFFDGENVVACMVNVVVWRPLFGGGKMRQVLEFIFFGLPSWE